MPDSEESSGRRTLVLAAVLGGCAIGLAVAIPAAAFVVAPLGRAKGEGRWVKTIRADQLHEGEPKRIAIVADRRDAWTIEKDVELGSVWLVRHGETITA